MNNNKVCNNETKVPKTKEMNDRDYLNCVLELEKNMSNNLSTSLNEASNDVLFDELYNMFDEVKNNARDAYILAFQKGWYKLEEAEQQKITEKQNCLQQLFDELNN